MDILTGVALGFDVLLTLQVQQVVLNLKSDSH